MNFVNNLERPYLPLFQIFYNHSISLLPFAENRLKTQNTEFYTYTSNLSSAFLRIHSLVLHPPYDTIITKKQYFLQKGTSTYDRIQINGK